MKILLRNFVGRLARQFDAAKFCSFRTAGDGSKGRAHTIRRALTKPFKRHVVPLGKPAVRHTGPIADAKRDTRTLKKLAKARPLSRTRPIRSRAC